jgi:hypothetical protein
LISKKDIRRPGKRFLVRGLDQKGNAANCVETEHLIVVHDNNFFKVGSYVQTRGSIPLFWEQKPSMKWSPSVKIGLNAA